MSKSKDLIYKVRRNLWDRAYSVIDISDTALGFDLLVEGKFRVRVKSSRDQMLSEDGFVIANVQIGLGAFKGRYVITYLTRSQTGGTAISTNNPVHVFGLPLKKVEGYETKKVEGKKGSKKVKGSSILARTQYGVRGKAIDYTA